MSEPTYGMTNVVRASTTDAVRASTTGTGTSPAARDSLIIGDGQVSVAENVVQKIAGKACRDMPGVHSMDTGPARAFGALRERIPGSSGPSVAQGVGIEAGEPRPRSTWTS